jgi:actin-like ATPase involved in cell morphogenesis
LGSICRTSKIVEVDFAANIGADLAILRPEGDIVAYNSGASEIPVPFVPAIKERAHPLLHRLQPEPG